MVYRPTLSTCLASWLREFWPLSLRAKLGKLGPWWSDVAGFSLGCACTIRTVPTVSQQMHWCAWPSFVPRRRPTTTLTASSLRRSPHTVIGTAESQSPMWSAASNLARWYCSVLSSSSDRNVWFVTAVSRALWLILWGWTSSWEADSDCQLKSDVLKSFSSTWHLCRMRSSSDCVLAAEDKKAEDASLDTLHTPKPPERTGRLWKKRETLRICVTAERKRLSSSKICECSQQGLRP